MTITLRLDGSHVAFLDPIDLVRRKFAVKFTRGRGGFCTEPSPVVVVVLVFQFLRQYGSCTFFKIFRGLIAGDAKTELGARLRVLVHLFGFSFVLRELFHSLLKLFTVDWVFAIVAFLTDAAQVFLLLIDSSGSCYACCCNQASCEMCFHLLLGLFLIFLLV